MAHCQQVYARQSDRAKYNGGRKKAVHRSGFSCSHLAQLARQDTIHVVKACYHSHLLSLLMCRMGIYQDRHMPDSGSLGIGHVPKPDRPIAAALLVVTNLMTVLGEFRSQHRLSCQLLGLATGFVQGARP